MRVLLVRRGQTTRAKRSLQLYEPPPPRTVSRLAVVRQSQWITSKGSQVGMRPSRGGKSHCPDSGSDEPCHDSARNNEDVVNDRVRRGNLAIAVVPGELGQFEHVENRCCIGTKLCSRPSFTVGDAHRE